MHDTNKRHYQTTHVFDSKFIYLFHFQVVSNAVRQLQHLVIDEACVDCHELYNTEKKSLATGGYCGTAMERQLAELVYQKRAEKLLADENCFKVFIVSTIYL